MRKNPHISGKYFLFRARLGEKSEILDREATIGGCAQDTAEASRS